jgi:hypothetical protein
MTRGARRSPLGHRRGRVTRSLVAGVMLVLELPLLLPLIAGAGAMALVVQLGALTERLKRGQCSK